MVSIAFIPNDKSEIPDTCRNRFDLSNEEEIDLRYKYFNCWVTFSAGDVTLLERSYVPLLDFMLALAWAIREVRTGGSSSITFTEHSGEIRISLSGDHLRLEGMGGAAAQCLIGEFVRSSLDFATDGIGYLLSKYPSLEFNPSVQRLRGEMDEWRQPG
ncbi:hypothetical protein ACQEVM_37050 [Streptomyces sp. CA-243310]|uniref:hypothetical protein n=1 Tax=Streptomyces sp. CA-243310 TaxID=3240056 RepID=UPI003D934DFA